MRARWTAPLLVLGACAQSAPPAPIARAPQAVAVQSAALSEPPLQVVPRVRKAIDWAAAASHPRLESPLTLAQMRVLRDAELPVLLPAAQPWLAVGVATAGRDWYSLSARHGDWTVVVQGDRVASRDPDLAPRDWTPPTWPAPLVTRNEGVVEATFLAFGASYNVGVECAQHETDPRCRDDAFVLELVASLRRWSPGGAAP